MCRFYCICFFLFVALADVGFSQEQRQNEGVPPNSVEEPLKAFQPGERFSPDFVKWAVMVLVFGSIGCVIFMFILYALLYEPPNANLPSVKTTVERREGVPRYRHQREEKTERYRIEDDL
jgi:hypothetical protein